MADTRRPAPVVPEGEVLLPTWRQHVRRPDPISTLEILLGVKQPQLGST
jgi:hypothetical protein